jgi:hypothetical protein
LVEPYADQMIRMRASCAKKKGLSPSLPVEDIQDANLELNPARRMVEASRPRRLLHPVRI